MVTNWCVVSVIDIPFILARDAQAKLALIVAQCLSIPLSVCPSVCLSATA